jgi:hypothetical protein
MNMEFHPMTLSHLILEPPHWLLRNQMFAHEQDQPEAELLHRYFLPVLLKSPVFPTKTFRAIYNIGIGSDATGGYSDFLSLSGKWPGPSFKGSWGGLP